VEALWQRMAKHAYWYGVEGIAVFAISAIDMALWDVEGKILGEPVVTLLGSMLRTEIPAMGSIIFDMNDLDWTLAEFTEMRDSGFASSKPAGEWPLIPRSVRTERGICGISPRFGKLSAPNFPLLSSRGTRLISNRTSRRCGTTSLPALGSKQTACWPCGISRG